MKAFKDYALSILITTLLFSFLFCAWFLDRTNIVVYTVMALIAIFVSIDNDQRRGIK